MHQSALVSTLIEEYYRCKSTLLLNTLNIQKGYIEGELVFIDCAGKSTPFLQWREDNVLKREQIKDEYVEYVQDRSELPPLIEEVASCFQDAICITGQVLQCMDLISTGVRFGLFHPYHGNY